MAERVNETSEDGKRSDYRRYRKPTEWLGGCCGVLQNLFGNMLTGVTWQMIIILLVLIEVVVNIILLLIAFHVVRDSEDHFASNILHFIAISILSIFIMELILKVFSLGLGFFWRNKWELFDAIIIVVAINMEILLRALHAEKWKGMELIIALRLWRVLRLISVMVSFKEEFYELIDDEIDGKKVKQDTNTLTTEPSETESLQAKSDQPK